MKIAITADPELPVPPHHYGGIERVIDMLIRSLVQRGHDVTLFAHADSKPACRLVPWPGASSLSRADTVRNALTLGKAVLMERYDLVHSFSRIAYMAPILPLPIPKLMTYQRAISRRSIELGHRLSRGTLHFSAISRWMMRHVEDVGDWRLVYNGVPMATYDFKAFVAPDAPLAFLGRVEEIKGPHIAIEVAKRTGIPLIIAGNIPQEHRDWYEANVAPHVDDRLIRYVGPVNDEQKSALLGGARAFLMPILWEEPFGIVMAEAMACGTPVIGYRRGAVPEVVTHGETGYVVDNVEELAAAVAAVDAIDRAAVRQRCETHFSDDVIARDYEKTYRSLVRAEKGQTAALVN
ncbi:glycosyltransferase family 4 protein [Methylocystis sp. FS]|uniref:glycosyltransferase family 4 protein n=1 Tax=Methylocystis silviterrae TaxID=2743612 RepID=UPI00158338FA|nr:glycosyltransferase family 4 protein [Methylocystis silviterrae]NUJ81635.1 glycosyltransferase family 4 protein [Methylocystis silviterrae]